MTDRPIIFSGPMIEALIAGRKTQTRRLATSPLRRCEPGDRLWVRESLRAKNMDLLGALGLSEPLAKLDPSRKDLCVSYAADGNEALTEHEFNYAWQWPRMAVPSIHMPRWASRITLAITHVKTEPLQDISDKDAIAEGIAWSDQYEGYHTEDCRHYHASDPVKSYASLWDTLHGDGAWLANPDVVALTFAVNLHNIDGIAR